MTCEYCEEIKPIKCHMASTHFHDPDKLTDSRLLVIRSNGQIFFEDVYNQTAVYNVKFCPMCGEKLGGTNA